MACESCGEKPKCHNKDFTKAVVEINNPESLILLRKVVVPASIGDETTYPPEIGKFRNVILQYEVNNDVYIYSSDGIPTKLDATVPQEVYDRIATLESEYVSLQQEVDELKNSPDVVDIVATYEELMDYDTSSLGDKDVIRVLTDETHDNESSYYRWDKTNSQWVFIGAVEGYYTRAQTNNLLNGKQDKLTAGSNINIDADNVISATDTTYSDFIGATSGEAGTAGLVPAPALGDVDKYLKSDGSWATVSSYSLPAATANTLGGVKIGSNLSMDSNDVLSATDTTYSNFVGTDGTAAGTAGLVPAPAATDAGKFLKADGTWDTAGGGGPTVVQSTGTSTTDVMSQNATTTALTNVAVVKKAGSNNNNYVMGNFSLGSFVDNNILFNSGTSASISNSSDYNIAIGYGPTIMGTSTNNAIAIGRNPSVTGNSAIALNGTASAQYAVAINGTASAQYSVAIGRGSSATVQGQFDIGTGSGTTNGYNSSEYRLLTGVYDGQSAHDAATKGQLDAIVITNAGAPTTSTVGTVGQILEDTTNGKLYICTDATNPYVWEEVGGSAGPTITMTTTDPGEGAALAANNFVAVYDETPLNLDYSTSEVDTGTVWVDGSAIYKKTLHVTAFPDVGAPVKIAHGITNLGTVIKIEGMATDGSIQIPIPFAFLGGRIITAFITDDGYVQFDSSQDETGFSGDVTLYYTKSS